MKIWIRNYAVEIIILLLTSLLISVATYLILHGNAITFLDTDDYMRLVRIQDFFDNNQNLADHIIERGNYPFGCDLHWTRLYDFFLIIPAYIVKLFVGSSHLAIKYVGFVISPIVKLITVVFLLRFFQKLMKEENAFLATMLFIAYPLLLSVASFGRPDHHAFIMLFMVIYMCNLSMVIETKFADKIAIILASITAALCIWISPETLIPLIATDAVFFVSTFFDKHQTEGLVTKNLLTAVFLGIIVFIFAQLQLKDIIAALALIATCFLILKNKHLSILGFLCALLLIRIYGACFAIEYDKISVVHVSLYLASVVFFGVNLQFQHLKITYRTLYYALSLCLIGVLFLVTYPRFLCGMSGDISDYVKTIWLSKVSEMRSPFEHGEYISFVSYSGIVAFMIFIKLEELSSKIFSSCVLWWMIIILSICYTICAAFSYRMMPYSILFSLPIIVNVCMEGRGFVNLHRYWRIGLSFLFTILFVFFSACLDRNFNATKTPTEEYTREELFAEIDKLSPTPVVIMAHSNDGPEILYFTKHKVVGAPYHRQYQGIISSYEVMEADYNRDTVKRNLLNTDATYILIKKPKPDKNRHDLPHMIASNIIPAGMNVVKFPPKFKDIVILKIDKSRL